MSRYIDGTWLLNFFVGMPDDYTLTIGNLRAVVNDAPSIDICAYGKYCMCATCFYQNDCSNCADCISNNKQIHDTWSCTKYMRKEHLRKGATNDN